MAALKACWTLRALQLVSSVHCGLSSCLVLGVAWGDREAGDTALTSQYFQSNGVLAGYFRQGLRARGFYITALIKMTL